MTISKISISKSIFNIRTRSISKAIIYIKFKCFPGDNVYKNLSISTVKLRNPDEQLAASTQNFQTRQVTLKGISACQTVAEVHVFCCLLLLIQSIDTFLSKLSTNPERSPSPTLVDGAIYTP